MKRRLTALCAFLAALAWPVLAEPILVATEENAPYNYTDDKQNVTGLATDIVREVMARTKLDYQIESFPWARAYKMAQTQPNVAIYSIGRNEEREKLFKWVGVIVNREVFLYKMKNRTDVKASKLPDLKNYILGGVRDDVRTMTLMKEGFAVELVTDDISNIKKLQLNRIDAFATDDLALMALADRAGIDVNTLDKLIKLDTLSSGLSLAFSLKTPDETVEKCRVALESMKKDGSFARIEAKWKKRRDK